MRRREGLTWSILPRWVYNGLNIHVSPECLNVLILEVPSRTPKMCNSVVKMCKSHNFFKVPTFEWRHFCRLGLTQEATVLKFDCSARNAAVPPYFKLRPALWTLSFRFHFLFFRKNIRTHITVLVLLLALLLGGLFAGCHHKEVVWSPWNRYISPCITLC